MAISVYPVGRCEVSRWIGNLSLSVHASQLVNLKDDYYLVCVDACFADRVDAWWKPIVLRTAASRDDANRWNEYLDSEILDTMRDSCVCYEIWHLVEVYDENPVGFDYDCSLASALNYSEGLDFDLDFHWLRDGGYDDSESNIAFGYPQLYRSPDYRPVEYLNEGEKGFLASFDYAKCASLNIVLGEEFVDGFLAHLKRTAEEFWDLGVIVSCPIGVDEYGLAHIDLVMRFSCARRNFAFYTQLRGFERLPRVITFYKENDNGYLNFILNRHSCFVYSEDQLDGFFYFGNLTRKRIDRELKEVSEAYLMHSLNELRAAASVE